MFTMLLPSLKILGTVDLSSPLATSAARNLLQTELFNIVLYYFKIGALKGT